MHLLGVCILLVLLFLMILLTREKKEGFDDNIGRLIPIHVSDDQSQITTPNTIKSHNEQPFQFYGNIKATDLNVTDLQATQGTVDRLITENAVLNDVTLNKPVQLEGSQVLEFGADTAKSKPENGTLGYKTPLDTSALNIVGAENGGPRKVHLWDDVEIEGDLHVNGTITIGPNGQSWSLNTRGNGWMDFLHNDTSPDDLGNDVGHIIMAPDGNLWLSRATYRGWIADNLQGVNGNREYKIQQERQRIQYLLEQAQREWQAAQDAIRNAFHGGGGGGGCSIS